MPPDKDKDKSKPTRRRSPSRADKAAETKAAIVKAALHEFTERGFAGARLDEISKRANVAKGTIYIHFKDKEALFEGIVRQIILPHSEAMDAKVKERPPSSPEEFLEEYLMPLLRGMQADHRVDILRLQISEGPRFPALTEIYYRVVVEPSMAKIEAILKDTVKPQAKDLADFPQLVMAPVIMGLIWNLLFAQFRPVDVEAMLRTQFRLMSIWMNGCLETHPHDAPGLEG